MGELWAGLRVWQAVINEEAEHFIGDALLQGQEKIKSVTKLVRELAVGCNFSYCINLARSCIYTVLLR